MAEITFKGSNPKGYAAIRKSPEVVELLESIAQRVADTANQGHIYKADKRGETGYLTDTTYSKTRARTSVRTVGAKAMTVEAQEKRLQRALHHQRGA